MIWENCNGLTTLQNANSYEMVIKSEENSFSIVIELLKEMGDLITRSPTKDVKPNILNITLQKFLVTYMVVT